MIECPKCGWDYPEAEIKRHSICSRCRQLKNPEVWADNILSSLNYPCNESYED